MKFDVRLLNLDYLIFSSHKTATQTLVKTLNKNGFICKHCHELKNIGIKKGAFEQYLKQYYEKNRKKLEIITIFRDPIERHISSFFQWYGSKPLVLKEVNNEFDTIIYKSTLEQLHEQFILEIKNRSLIGIEESLGLLCYELDFNLNELIYDEDKEYCLYESAFVRLFVFRFDVLTNELVTKLSTLTKKNIIQYDANRSKNKWYDNKYSEFKESLKIPHGDIFKIYDSRKELINILYQNNFEGILTKAHNKYG